MKRIIEYLKKQNKSKKKGFTLIELLAVIVILAIVLVVTIPSVIRSMSSAKEGQLANAAETVADWLNKQYGLANLGIDYESVDPAYTAFVNAYGGEFPASYGTAVSSSKNMGSYENESLAMLEAAGISNPVENIDLENSYVWIKDNKVGVKLSAKDGGVFYSNNGTNSSYTNHSDNDIAYLKNYKIYGNSIQNGTPSPNNPVEIKSVGDLVTDSTDSNYGKYKIPVTASNGVDTITTNIYLDEPLRGIYNSSDKIYYADYIDFENGKIVRRIYERIFDGSESFSYGSGYFRNYNVTYATAQLSDSAICNMYPVLRSSGRQYNCVFGNNANKNATNIMDNGYSDVDTFTSYLKGLYNAGTPLIIYYALSTTTELDANLPQIPFLDGNVTYSIDTTVQPSKDFEYEKY